MSNGKGDRNRISDIKRFRNNFDHIEGMGKNKLNTKSSITKKGKKK